MQNIDNKIKKICNKLEKEFGGQAVCGTISKREEIATMPVSINKTQQKKDEYGSSYNQPVGVIEIKKDKIRFIPLDRKKDSVIKTIFRLLVLTIAVFGLKKVFRSDRKWDAE